MIMKKWIYPVSCLLIASSLTACGNNTATPNPATQGTGQAHTAQTQNDTANRFAPSQIIGWASSGGQAGQGAGQRTQQAQPAQQMAFDHRLADQVAHVADQVPGVQGATAIVRGNDIVVGINTRATNQTATQRQVIERQVYSSVHAIAPRHNIRISSDATMVTRIRTLAQNVRGYGQEMTNGPTTVGANLTNAGRDFGTLVRDLGRTVTAPFR